MSIQGFVDAAKAGYGSNGVLTDEDMARYRTSLESIPTFSGPLTAAQLTSAKSAIGGLGVSAPNPYGTYVSDATSQVAPLREDFYQQYTSPGYFAVPYPRATDLGSRYNPFTQNTEQMLNYAQPVPFSASAAPVSYAPQQRAAAGDRLFGILSAAASRGLI